MPFQASTRRKHGSEAEQPGARFQWQRPRKTRLRSIHLSRDKRERDT
jgi:hypothetical protein